MNEQIEEYREWLNENAGTIGIDLYTALDKFNKLFLPCGCNSKLGEYCKDCVDEYIYAMIDKTEKENKPLCNDGTYNDRYTGGMD